MGEVESNESVSSLGDHRLALVTVNTEILVFWLCGVIGIVLEVAGYWPALELKDLFPEQSEEAFLYPELRTVILKISDGLDVAGYYSVHIYLATYILLPYPLLTEKQRVLLVPWLLCAVLRSLLLNLLKSFAAVVLCSSADSGNYRCLQYAFIYGFEFSTSLFVWTTVHNFYYYLVKRKSDRELNMVIKTIHKVGMRRATTESVEEESMLSEDLPGTEATLVERAAMAWIAREILEDDGDYVTDSQFTQYLAERATEELREIMCELAERRRETRRRDSSVHQRVKDSLEFCRTTSTYHHDCPSVATLPPNLEAFDESAILSRRDPIRRIPHLVFRSRPLEEDDSVVGEDRTFLEPWKINPDSDSSAAIASSVEVQTDPLSPQMVQLLDILDQKYETQRTVILDNQHKKEEK